jgi:ribose-phosphate pyrophosphokinase
LFPQLGETVRGRPVYIVQVNDGKPDQRIMETLVITDACYLAGAGSITIVWGYIPYQRTDRKNQKGTPSTFALTARLYAAAFATRILSLDIHNPTVLAGFTNLQLQYNVVTARPRFIEWLDKNLQFEMVVSPDFGSVKRSGKLADMLKKDLAAIDKNRNGNSGKSEAKRLFGNVEGKICLLFDDEADTLGTLVNAEKLLYEHRAAMVYAATIHAPLSGPAVKLLQQSKIRLFTTDSIPADEVKRAALGEQLTQLPVTAPLLAEAMRRLENDESLSDMFDYEPADASEEDW